MTYPNSSDVSSGQPTASAHYNNLRKDALTLGQLPADSHSLGSFFSRFAANIKLIYLATNRIRVVFNLYHPPAVMVGGCMLKAEANVDLPSSSFSGAAAIYYIHAVRTPGSTAFTLSVNTTPVESVTSRVIGTCYWDGTNVIDIVSFYDTAVLPAADFDSGWFACAYSQTYTKTQNLNTVPRMIMVFHSTDPSGNSELMLISIGGTSGGGDATLVSVTGTAVIVQTNTNATNGCCYATRRQSSSGFYRILAWR